MTKAAMLVAAALLSALSAAMTGEAAAQQGGAEERLREALRRTTLELRALQDATAGERAALEEAKKQRDLLQQTVDRQTLRIAELEAQASGAAVLTQRETELAQLRADFATLQASNEQLLQGIKQWQAAHGEVADVARAKDAERRQAEARAAAIQDTLGVCQEKNQRLTGVAEDILGLYQSQDFRSVWLRSYEPLLGLQRVELETIVQDYQDRILDERFAPPSLASDAPPAPAGTDDQPR